MNPERSEFSSTLDQHHNDHPIASNRWIPPQELTLIFEQMEGAIALIDASQHLVSCNLSFAQLFSLTSEPQLSLHWSELAQAIESNHWKLESQHSLGNLLTASTPGSYSPYFYRLIQINSVKPNGTNLNRASLTLKIKPLPTAGWLLTAQPEEQQSASIEPPASDIQPLHFQQVKAELQQQNQQSQLLAEITLKIRQSLQLDEILRTTVEEVQTLLQVDRAIILKLQGNGRAVVVKEANSPNCVSVLSAGYTDDCFGPAYLQKYDQGRIYALSDAETAAAPCFINFLHQLDIKSKLVVPILRQEKLWGLLILHQCRQIRQWNHFEIEILQRIANQVSIALTQAQLLHALQESESKFRNIVEKTNDWVWETDRQGRFTYVNPRVQDILGYGPETMIGKTTCEFMRPAEVKRFTEIVSRYTRQEQPFVNLEKTLIHQQGHSVVLETSGSPVVDRQGKLQGYRGTARDITARKQAEQDIRRALAKEKELNELKSHFVSMTSHEFRTPLSTILSAAELLEFYGQEWETEEREEQLHLIQASVKHMTRLLEDMLLLGKAEAGMLRVSPSWFNLNTFCETLMATLQQNAGAKHRLIFSSDTQNLQVCLDEKLLRQILTNLLSNAVNYSPEGGTIQLNLVCEATQVSFHVQDQGIGIPPADQLHLFESFFRATNAAALSGTGLGLAIVKQCVDSLNGSVTFESKVNIGTTFTIRLPLHSDCAEARTRMIS